MKKPESMEVLPRKCEECFTNFNEEVIVHPIQKTYQGNTRLSWGNADGSGHITKVGEDFIHIWSEKEKELAKIGGTASLSMHRQNNKPIELGGNKEPPSTPPKPREMDAADFAEPAMRAEVKVHCKFLSIIENEVENFLMEQYHDHKTPNPNHVGMYVKLIQDMMEKK